MPKKSNPSKAFDREREFTVVLEDINGKFNLLSEGQDLIKDKLDATMGRVAKIIEDTTMTKLQASGIKNNIERINGKLTTMKTDIMILKSDVSTLKSDVKRIDRRFDKFEDHTDKRLTRLEAVVK